MEKKPQVQFKGGAGSGPKPGQRRTNTIGKPKQSRPSTSSHILSVGPVDVGAARVGSTRAVGVQLNSRAVASKLPQGSRDLNITKRTAVRVRGNGYVVGAGVVHEGRKIPKVGVRD